MRFDIIHPDPVINVRLLPEYSIKKVNCREGFQILSDIGHLLGEYWEGQNKSYSILHPEVRKYSRDRESFSFFVNHYEACCTYLVDTLCGSDIWVKKFETFRYGRQEHYLVSAYAAIMLKLDEHKDLDEFQDKAAYLLRYKRENLYSKEIFYLDSIINGNVEELIELEGWKE